MIQSKKNKNIIDAHFHVFSGGIENLKSLVELSSYKNKYMAYNELSLPDCEFERHCNQFEKVFCMPFFLKEITATEANQALLQVIPLIPNAMAIPLIDNSDLEFTKFADMPIIGAKEHFMLHNAFEVSERKKAYNFLEKHNKFLLIHCSSSLRADYLQYLRTQFPNLRIQVAHLGCYRRNIKKTYELIDLFANDENIYFDISTVFNTELIKYLMEKLNYKRILFGTDKPFVSKRNDELITFIMDIIRGEYYDKIFRSNALELIGHL